MPLAKLSAIPEIAPVQLPHRRVSIGGGAGASLRSLKGRDAVERFAVTRRVRPSEPLSRLSRATGQSRACALHAGGPLLPFAWKVQATPSSGHFAGSEAASRQEVNRGP